MNDQKFELAAQCYCGKNLYPTTWRPFNLLAWVFASVLVLGYAHCQKGGVNPHWNSAFPGKTRACFGTLHSTRIRLAKRRKELFLHFQKGKRRGRLGILVPALPLQWGTMGFSRLFFPPSLSTLYTHKHAHTLTHMFSHRDTHCYRARN